MAVIRITNNSTEPKEIPSYFRITLLALLGMFARNLLVFTLKRLVCSLHMEKKGIIFCLSLFHMEVSENEHSDKVEQICSIP